MERFQFSDDSPSQKAAASQLERKAAKPPISCKFLPIGRFVPDGEVASALYSDRRRGASKPRTPQERRRIGRAPARLTISTSLQLSSADY
jgi:hypothetical protein